MMNELYLYDGTFEGFLSAVFDAYARGNASPAIQPEEHGQMMLGASLYHVESNEKKSGRVMKKLYSLLGRNGFYRLCRAFLSEEEDREEALFGYIRLVISHGRAA